MFQLKVIKNLLKVKLLIIKYSQNRRRIINNAHLQFRQNIYIEPF